jgi:hypothetical protein
MDLESYVVEEEYALFFWDLFGSANAEADR